MQKTKVVILGAGICGLSCAWALLESPSLRNLDITVVAETFTPNTTSDVAGGLWFPYATSHKSIFRWCEATRTLYRNLDSALWGLSYPEFIWYEHGEEGRQERASWAHLFPDLTFIPSPARMPKNAARQFRTTAPLVETPKFMSKLMETLKGKGVQFEQACIQSLESIVLDRRPDFVVNCCGIRAADLVQDREVFPIRGVLLKVEPTPAGRDSLRNKCFCFDDNPEGMSYVFPREDGVWVGGVAEKNNTTLSASDSEVTKILVRAQDMCPELIGCTVREVRVALRPGRSAIRLESERIRECKVIHNYGHGGSGWTVMWGCAVDVAAMIKDGCSSAKL